MKIFCGLHGSKRDLEEQKQFEKAKMKDPRDQSPDSL